MNYKIAVSCFALLALVVFTGCPGAAQKGPKVEYVEGVVTLDGTPVPGAHVSFEPENPESGLEPASGYSDEKGLYKLTSNSGAIDKGAMAGKYKVAIRKVDVTNYVNEDGTFMANAPRDPATGEQMGSTQKQILPEATSRIRTTTLEATVVEGKNTIPFDLKN